MTVIKCKMCGGDIILSSDKTIGICEYCGSSMTLPKVENQQRAAVFNRGNHFRRIGEFDKALAVYEKIVSENEQDAEAHWCCALCRFGIEYVEDPNTMEWFPTCHRVSFDSFLEDVDYKAAVEHSEGITRRQYVKEGMKIAEVQKGILLTSQNTKPYDIFLCYKETNENGDRTRDSILAQEIYYRLTEQGRTVFFSRITLEDVPGTAYEPYIFAALNSAKVMIVVGTKPEYLNAPWVKNEWSRFLTLMKKDRSKLLLPCYRDMDPYNLPEQLGVLQSFDMGKIGFLQDLTRGIAKVLDHQPGQQEAVIMPAASVNPAPLLKRAFIFLEDGDWKSADEYCEKVLDIDPENAEAYLGKLLAERHIPGKELLGQSTTAFDKNANYQKALRYGDGSMTAFLASARKDFQYSAVKRRLSETPAERREKAFLGEVIAELETLSGWRDADVLVESCREQLRKIAEQEETRHREKHRREAEQRKAAERKAKRLKKTMGILIPAVCAVIVLVLLANSVVIPLLQKPGKKISETVEKTIISAEETVPAAETEPEDPTEAAYLQAEALEAEGQLGKAAIAFGKLAGYKDARVRSMELWDHVAVRDTVSTTSNYFLTSYVKKDGTVSPVGDWYGGRAFWRNEIKTWTDIVAIDCGGIIGLKSDGTVVAVDVEGQFSEVSEWQDIVSVGANWSGNACGLRMDGTVAVTRSDTMPEIAEWTDIVAIDFLDGYFIGLRTDGTVVVAGENQDEQCISEVKKWRDIVAIDAASGVLNGRINEKIILGLKSDGTVVSSGTNSMGQCDVSEWKNIIKISASITHTVGICSDGSFVTAGSNRDGERRVGNEYDGGWKNVIDIIAGRNYTIGLKKDGSAIATGNNRYGESSVVHWTDIALPGQLHTKFSKAPTDLQSQYEAAEALLTNGETAKAAIAFGKLGDYSDARERSFALWRKVTPKQIGCSTNPNTAVVKKDGTVMLFDYSDNRQRQCLEWTDITAVSSYTFEHGGHTVGLKTDGTVVAAGANGLNQCETSDWTDIVAIEAGALVMTIGLKADGTVVYTGDNSPYSEETYIHEVSSWKDIVGIRMLGYSVFGLKSDGTVAVARIDEHAVDESYFADWSDIVAITAGGGSCGSSYFGLKADGTVIETTIKTVYNPDNSMTRSEIKTAFTSQWSDIVAITTGRNFVLGLKGDGTVVSVGLNDEEIPDFSDWYDIKSIYVYNGYYDGYAVGMKQDGSLISAGKTGNSALIKNWSDIKLPN